MRCLLMGAPLQCCEGAMQWQQPVRVKAAEPGGCWPRQPTATKKTSTAQAGRRPSDAFGSPRNSRRGSARSARCRLVVVRLYRRIPGGPTATGDHRVWRCDRFEPLWTCRSPLPAIGHEQPFTTGGYRAGWLTRTRHRPVAEERCASARSLGQVYRCAPVERAPSADPCHQPRGQHSRSSVLPVRASGGRRHAHS